MKRVTDGRVGKEKNRPQETVIKTKDVRWTAWIRVKQWPSWRPWKKEEEREKVERKRNQRGISTVP